MNIFDNDKQRIKNKLETIEKNKLQKGSRKDKRLRKYSENFNAIFSFFLKSYRAGILDFSGSIINIDRGLTDAKFAFRQYDNGEFKHINPVSKHTNILYAVI